MIKVVDYTRTFCTIILKLYNHALDNKAQVFQYIQGLKDNVKAY